MTLKRLSHQPSSVEILMGILLLAIPTMAWSTERPDIPIGGTNAEQHAATGGIAVQEAGLNELLECLLGPDVTVSNATLDAAAGAAGTFSGGAGVLGIDSGIVLSSGNISSLVGPNMLDDTSTDNAFPGDPDLDPLVPGTVTYDRTVLEFDFECAQAVAVSFLYVFASEEYNEYVNSIYNDVFAFFVDGNTAGDNIAIVPGFCSDPGLTVAINNVNCGNPYAPPGGGPNCNCFRNNDLDDGGGAIDTEMDGLTQVFSAVTNIAPGVHHIKIAIADAGDYVLDSNVMIRCESFVCGAPTPQGACCLQNGECIVITQDDCNAAGGRFIGNGTDCDPYPCATPVEPSTWGKIKHLYHE